MRLSLLPPQQPDSSRHQAPSRRPHLKSLCMHAIAIHLCGVQAVVEARRAGAAVGAVYVATSGHTVDGNTTVAAVAALMGGQGLPSGGWRRGRGHIRAAVARSIGVVMLKGSTIRGRMVTAEGQLAKLGGEAFDPVGSRTGCMYRA
eukprot:1078175-Pelagomonas_calceolata.AAC.1